MASVSSSTGAAGVAVVPLVPATAAAPALSAEQLFRYDMPGPRYTSYPTADRFVEAFGPADVAGELAKRAQAAAAGSAAPLSLYVHIPFCESICYYCACNKVITRQHDRAVEYLDMLEVEIAALCRTLAGGNRVTQLHFGGGSPTFLSDSELGRAVDSLRRAFRIDDAAETSIEVDPRTVTVGRLRHLRSLGFRRVSFGVQDFDPQVQQAVHRIQPFEAVRDLIAGARDAGFESINADLIYGLPRQTPAGFARTLAQVGEVRPDRIALYAYAHLPHRFKPQRRIHAGELPDGAARVAMLGEAIAAFRDAGYDYIGMDHFALPGDPLAVAKRAGRLHRNFQGYTTQPDGDLIGLGVSAISRIGAIYAQNAKTLEDYYRALRGGELPVVRGVRLAADDELRREVIMALMCQGRVDYEPIERAHGVRFDDYFGSELARLRPLVDDGLVRLEARALEVTPVGWYLVRAMAMAFDRHLAVDRPRERFSRIV